MMRYSEQFMEHIYAFSVFCKVVLHNASNQRIPGFWAEADAIRTWVVFFLLIPRSWRSIA